MRTLPLILALCLCPQAQAADVYRCVDKGVTTYQDTPCKAPGVGGVVRIQEPPPPTGNTAGQQEVKQLRESVDAMSRERRQREISAEIDDLERTVKRLTAEQAAELEPIQARRTMIANNFVGDPYGYADIDRALAKDMAAVSAKYRERTEAVRKRIADLRLEQKALSAPPPQ